MRYLKQSGAWFLSVLLTLPTTGLSLHRESSVVRRPWSVAKAPASIRSTDQPNNGQRTNPESRISNHEPRKIPARITWDYQGDTRDGHYRLNSLSTTIRPLVADGRDQTSHDNGRRTTDDGRSNVAVSGAESSQQQPVIVRLSLPNAIPGSQLTVSGNFPPNSQVRLARILFRDCDFTRGLAETPVDSSGRFSQLVTIPEDATPGPHEIIVVGAGVNPPMGQASMTVDTPAPGSISGVVTVRHQDGTTRPEPNVTVKIVRPGVGVVRSGSTDARGRYDIPDIPAGCIEIVHSKSGYVFQQPQVEARPGQHIVVDAIGVEVLNSVFFACETFSQLNGPRGVQMFAALSKAGGIGSSSRRCGISGILDIGQFASMPGRGVPVINRITAIPPFDFRGQRVTFEITNGNSLIKTVEARPFGLDWVADIDMSEFPASPTPYQVRVALPLCNFGPSLQFTMVDVPWFNSWVTNPQVRFDVGQMHYQFSGILPKPAFDFNSPIDLGIVKLDNIVRVGIPVQETLRLDGSWDGSAKAQALIEFLSIDFLNEELDYEPSGGPFPTRTYTLPTVHEEQFKFCIPIPGLTWVLGFDFCWCIFTCCEFIGASFTVSVCLAGFVDVDSKIKEDLSANLTVSPGITLSIPIELKLGVLICSATGRVEPAVTVKFPLVCDLFPDPACGFDNPCLEIYAILHYKISCLGIKVAGGDYGTGRIRVGCRSDEAPPDSPLAQTFGVEPLSPSPSVASNGAGRALAVWMQEDSTDPNTPRRRLYYSVNDGTNWSAPQPIYQGYPLVDAPNVAFYGPNRAVAVWVQNKLTFQQAQMSDAPTLLSNSELYYATWDGRRWSAPTAITNDTALDSGPALAAEPSSGQAMLVWNRFNEAARPGQFPIGIAYSSFDGRRWSAPAFIDPNWNARDSGPKVGFDRNGQAVAMWLRDMDKDPGTSPDRQIVLSRLTGRTWSAPEVIPNLPTGPYAPSFAFDKSNNLIIVFLIPPVDPQTGQLTTGESNQSPLYAAYRRRSTWEVTPVGSNTYGEQPVVKVNPDNRAIVMYRQFGNTGDVHLSGDLAAAVADLNAPRLQWTTGYLTADGLTNWEVAFDVDRQTSKNFVLNVKKTPGDSAEAQANAAAALAKLPKGDPLGASESVEELTAVGPMVSSMVVPYAVDLAVTPQDIVFSNAHPVQGEQISIVADVRNAGLKATSASTPFTVKLYDGDPARGGTLIGQQQIQNSLPFNTLAPVTVPYTVTRGGLHTITVVVDQENTVAESNEMNNAAQVTLGQMLAPSSVFARADSVNRVIKLGWVAPKTQGIDYYEIFRSTTAGRDYEPVGDTAMTDFVDTLAKPGTTYYYVVVAVDIYGTRSAFSNEARAQLP